MSAPLSVEGGRATAAVSEQEQLGKTAKALPAVANQRREPEPSRDATGAVDGFMPIPGFAFPPRDVLAQIAAHNVNQGRRTMPTMRAKMHVTSVAQSPTQETLKLSCVTSSAKPYGPNGENEDNSFARYTPFGEATYTISNPDLLGQFKQGDTFYVDFTPAE